MRINFTTNQTSNGVKIDGSYGEGGGQILRTGLALSVLTSRALEIYNIRAKRKKPGLRDQHLVCVQAAQKISGAKVSGAEISSQLLRFEPQKVSPGQYQFDIGTAGSTSLVFQTILLPLGLADDPSEISLIGGTHNPLAPSFHYLKEIFLPMVSQLGIKVEARLEKYGFYPKGGGQVRFFIKQTKMIQPKDFLERGDLQEITGTSLVANLPLSIATRQKLSATRLLKDCSPSIKTEEVKAFSPGTFIFLKAKYQNALAGFSALGERGKPAEKVGEEAAKMFSDYHQSQIALEPHLADQIILYLAASRQSFSFTTSQITNHLRTHIWLLEKFLELKININETENRISTK
jgi:RNA 3'-terminal phosphate cyclase (ATP)